MPVTIGSLTVGLQSRSARSYVLPGIGIVLYFISCSTLVGVAIQRVVRPAINYAMENKCIICLGVYSTLLGPTEVVGV